MSGSALFSFVVERDHASPQGGGTQVQGWSPFQRDMPSESPCSCVEKTPSRADWFSDVLLCLPDRPGREVTACEPERESGEGPEDRPQPGPPGW